MRLRWSPRSRDSGGLGLGLGLGLLGLLRLPRLLALTLLAPPLGVEGSGLGLGLGVASISMSDSASDSASDSGSEPDADTDVDTVCSTVVPLRRLLPFLPPLEEETGEGDEEEEEARFMSVAEDTGAVSREPEEV